MGDSGSPASPVLDSNAAQRTDETGGNTAHNSEAPTDRVMPTSLIQACQRVFWSLSDHQYNTGAHTEDARINTVHTNGEGFSTRDVSLNGVLISEPKATQITSPLLPLVLSNKPDPNHFEIIGTVHAEGVRIRLNGRPAGQIPTQDLSDLLLGLHDLPPGDRLDERVFVLQGSLVGPR